MGCHFLLQGMDLPDQRIEAVSLVSPALAGRFFTNCSNLEAGKILIISYIYYNIICIYRD